MSIKIDDIVGDVTKLIGAGYAILAFVTKAFSEYQKITAKIAKTKRKKKPPP